MNYEETTLQRQLRWMVNQPDSKIKNEPSNEKTEKVPEPTVEEVLETISIILYRFEAVCGCSVGETIDLTPFILEFGKIQFGDKDELIGPASELLFKRTLKQRHVVLWLFDFIPIHPVTTRQKFVKTINQLCGDEVQLLSLEVSENKRNPDRSPGRVLIMIEYLYKKGIISTKTVLDYIDVLLPGMGSDEIALYLIVLLERIGPELDSVAKAAELYMKGMTKLGKTLGWFSNFKSLDPVFLILEKLSSDQDGNVPGYLRENLKRLCELRESGWKTKDDLTTQGRVQTGSTTSHQEGKGTVESGAEDEADAQTSDSESESDDETAGTNRVTRTDSELAEYFQDLTIGNPISAEVLNEMKLCLLSRRDYFHFWLGDYSVTLDNLKEIRSSLYDIIRPPKGSGEYEDFEKEKPINAMMTLQEAASPLVEAFLNLKVGNLKLVKSNVMWVEKLVQYFLKSKIVSEEHCSGLEYLCSLLRIDWSLNDGTATDELVRRLDKLKYDDLKPKGKSMVWITRWMLNQSLLKRKEESTQDLKQARDLDPDNWVWNFVLCSRLRFIRRQKQANNSMPDEEELQAIINAVKFAPPTTYDMCISGLCQSLAEILRCTTTTRMALKPVDIGTQKFTSNEQIMKYILDQVGKVLEGESAICFAEYIRYGEILTSILPKEYRDYDLAEICYLNCLRIFPQNSKAHHRMGLLQLTGKLEVKKAILHFEFAILLQSQNFPAWMDLLQTSLGMALEDKEEVGKRFSKALALSHWNAASLSSLHFWYGCFHWITENKDAAITEWTQIREGDSRFPYFDKIHFAQRRYLWPKSMDISIHEVLDEILIRLKLETVTDRDSLLVLASIVENVAAGQKRGYRNPGSGYQQQGYQSRGYSTSNRNLSGSEDHEYNERRGGEVQRTRPVSIADSDNSWRRSSADAQDVGTSTSPRLGSQTRASQPYGESPSTQQNQFSSSPRNVSNNRRYDNNWNSGRQGNYRQNRPPSPESWR